MAEPFKIVKYFCKSGECTAKDKNKHVDKGDIVLLFAVGTNVTLEFPAAKPSPFVSGVKLINIPANSGHFEVIKDDPAMESKHPYLLKCESCPPSADPDNPQLIVDP